MYGIFTVATFTININHSCRYRPVPWILWVIHIPFTNKEILLVAKFHLLNSWNKQSNINKHLLEGWFSAIYKYNGLTSIRYTQYLQMPIVYIQHAYIYIYINIMRSEAHIIYIPKCIHVFICIWSPAKLASKFKVPKRVQNTVNTSKKWQKVGSWWGGIYIYIYITSSNPKQPFINGCFNWMIPNLYIENGCFTKHPFINGCLGFQDNIILNILLEHQSSLGYHVIVFRMTSAYERAQKWTAKTNPQFGWCTKLHLQYPQN